MIAPKLGLLMNQKASLDGCEEVTALVRSAAQVSQNYYHRDLGSESQEGEWQVVAAEACWLFLARHGSLVAKVDYASHEKVRTVLVQVQTNSAQDESFH